METIRDSSASAFADSIRISRKTGVDGTFAVIATQSGSKTTYDDTEFYFVMPSDKLDVGMYIECFPAPPATMTMMSSALWHIGTLNVLSPLP